MNARDDQDYCGCCGKPCRGEFCGPCRDHLLPVNRHAWERTYFAQFGVDCPRQEPWNVYQGIAIALTDIEGTVP